MHILWVSWSSVYGYNFCAICCWHFMAFDVPCIYSADRNSMFHACVMLQNWAWQNLVEMLSWDNNWCGKLTIMYSFQVFQRTCFVMQVPGVGHPLGSLTHARVKPNLYPWGVQKPPNDDKEPHGAGTLGSPCTCEERGLFVALEFFWVISMVDPATALFG